MFELMFLLVNDVGFQRTEEMCNSSIVCKFFIRRQCYAQRMCNSSIVCKSYERTECYVLKLILLTIGTLIKSS